ncbi:MAG: S-adenosylmethionine/S-adenosylhomocysteine transporter [Chlamydiae bacterium]|nr:S-adenosylmethionine/S-adenosylhomocysteine transporter [Chlamydiota bacterium]
MYLVFALYALFASVFTIGKVALASASPFFIVGSRMALAGSAMVIFQLIKDKKAFKMTFQSWVSVCLFALLGIYITNVCEFWSLQFLTSSKTCFLYSAIPFVSAFFSYLILKETMTRKKWWGLCIGLVGIIPIMLSGSSLSQLGGLFIFSWPEIVMMIAIITSALGWIYLRKTVAHETINLFVANGLGMLIGGIVTLGHSYFVEVWSPVPVMNWAGFIKSGIALLIVSNLLAYNLYGFLLKRYSATFMSFAGLSTPFFASLFGWVFLREVVPWPLWVGLGILSIGLVLFHQEEIKSKGFAVRVAEKTT